MPYAVTGAYYLMTACLLFTLLRLFWKSRDIQEAALCIVIAVPLVLRLLRVK